MASDLLNIKDDKEKAFVKKLVEYQRRADNKYCPLFTSFYQKDWMENTIQKYNDLFMPQMFFFFGGYQGAERQMLGICPYALINDDFPLKILEIKVNTGIGKP